MIGTTELWLTILGLGAGSYALRFVFLGIVGDRRQPAWTQAAGRIAGFGDRDSATMQQTIRRLAAGDCFPAAGDCSMVPPRSSDN